MVSTKGGSQLESSDQDSRTKDSDPKQARRSLQPSNYSFIQTQSQPALQPSSCAVLWMQWEQAHLLAPWSHSTRRTPSSWFSSTLFSPDLCHTHGTNSSTLGSLPLALCSSSTQVLPQGLAVLFPEALFLLISKTTGFLLLTQLPAQIFLSQRHFLATKSKPVALTLALFLVASLFYYFPDTWHSLILSPLLLLCSLSISSAKM